MKAAELFDVSGLVTIVTGGASGIGLGYCEVMADNGARVFAFDRDEDALKSLPKGMTGIAADVTDKAGLERAFADVAAQAGRIDVVFVNAGIGGGPGWLRAGEDTRNQERVFEDLPAEQWDRVIATNVTGAFVTIQAAARHMKPNKSGRIIVTSSCSAYKTEQYVGTPYVISKAAVAHMVRQSAHELIGYGINVNAIAPGPAITNISGGRLKDAETRKPFERIIPMHRLATPGDLQGLALFLASPASAYMTGVNILVDGGFTLGPAD